MRSGRLDFTKQFSYRSYRLNFQESEKTLPLPLYLVSLECVYKDLYYPLGSEVFGVGFHVEIFPKINNTLTYSHVEKYRIIIAQTYI